MSRESPQIAVERSFSGKKVAEVLDQVAQRVELPHWFASLEDARNIIEAWWVEYNTERPHTALNNQAPAVYRATWERRQQLAETG